MTSQYREGPGLCVFCDAISESTCSRCQCTVCAAHGPAGGPYCRVCAKEAKDEADLAQFKSTVFEESTGSAWTQSRSAGVESVIAWLGRLLFRQPQKREKPFAQRSPEDIRLWRREAGVHMRS